VDLDSSLAEMFFGTRWSASANFHTGLKNHNVLMCSRHIPCAMENVMREKCFAIVSDTARVDFSKFLKLPEKTGVLGD
jgi:hypothetical protein